MKSSERSAPLSDRDKNEQIDLLTEDFEDLYENAPCGYISIKPDGRIIRVNATFTAWIGRPAEMLVGRTLQDFLTIGTRLFYETHSVALLRLKGSFDGVSLEIKTAAGDILPVFASAMERRSADGRVILTRVVLFKSNERRQYERGLAEARESADAARDGSQVLLAKEREIGELREQFIAVLGHDLRSPLTSISGGAFLLQKETLSERGIYILETVQASVVRMSELIDNILDFARGRLGGGITLNREDDVLLEPLLKQIVSELRIGVPDANIETDIVATQPISCDRYRLGQMVSNLLGNAVTHGGLNEPIQLHARIKDDKLELSVCNSGKPIPLAAMERLFQPFFRGEDRHSQQGLGLGLHIASTIAAAHGGTLTATSSDEETRFTFRMPLRSAR